MANLNIRRFGATTLIVAALTVCGRAASPDSVAPAAKSSAARNSVGLFPELPDDGAESRLPSDLLDFIGRGSSVGGVVGSLPAPGPAELPSARAIELLERRRNWIYNTQSPSSFELSAEQTLGVRSSDTTQLSGQSQGWMADFFYDRGSDGPQSRPFDDILSRQVQVPGMNASLPSGSRSGLGLPGQTPTLGLAPFQAAMSQSAQSGSSVSGLTGDPGLRQGSESGMSSSVRDLLSTPGGMDPLAAGFDPINLRVDTTRQELNPTMTERYSDFRTTPKSVGALLDHPIRTIDSERPAFLDVFSARTLDNQSSLSPAVARLPEARATDRPLGFGQFPSRKF